MVARTRWVWGLAFLLALVWAACTLNPQPLPPAFDGRESPSADAGTNFGGNGDASTKAQDAGEADDMDAGLDDAGLDDAGADASDADPIQDAGRD